MKRVALLIAVGVLFVAGIGVGIAHAGVLSTVKAVAGAGSLWAGVGVLVLGFLLKRIPNDRIQAVVGGFAERLGVTITLGLSRYKYTRPFWNGVVEPWVVDLVDNTVGTFTTRFIKGLRSDDAPTGGQ